MKANVKQISIPSNKRVICISDIHGSCNLLKQLLKKITYSEDDVLILLGDLYTKGKQNHETLKLIIEMSKDSNVHVLRGNCDLIEEYLTDSEREWLDNLPHIIESQNYIFVHSGLKSSNLEALDAFDCMKNDAFMEQELKFEKYVIAGHFPVVNYTHEIPCFNPIINEEKRIISIDGGNVLRVAGQLNAFIIQNEEFSFEFVDELPTMQMKKSQTASGGSLNITWFDRFIEVLDDGDEGCGDEFGLYKHIQSEKTVLLPKKGVWTDELGRLCECDNGTDYYLAINKGDTVSIVGDFGKKLLAKKNGTLGWINT